MNEELDACDSLRLYISKCLEYYDLHYNNYIDYAIDLLYTEGGFDSLCVFLQDCQISSDESYSLACQWVSIRDRQYLLPEEYDFVYGTSYASNYEANVDTSSANYEYSDYQTGTNEGNQYETYDFTDFCDENFSNEENAVGDYVDWIFLAEEVERTLKEDLRTTQIYSANAILFALMLANCHVKTAAEILVYATSILNSCKPCRHLLQQGCYRNDCYFDHNLEQFPCRYWLYSTCSNDAESGSSSGKKCPFAHTIEVPSEMLVESSYYKHTEQSSGAVSTPQVVVREEDFPSLPLKSRKAAEKPASRQKGGIVIEFARYQPKDSSNHTNHNSNNYNANTYAKIKKTLAAESIGFADVVIDHAQNASNKSKLKDVSGVSLQKKKVQLLAISNWVSSGSELKKDYEAYRAEARAFAVARNKMLMEATVAYRNGSREVAKVLSLEGHRLNKLMKDCHMEAAKELFRKRNSMQSLEQGNIDLHGLHVQEAISCLIELIPLFKQMDMKVVNIITGSGHHSSTSSKTTVEGESTIGSKARLFPAIKQLLHSQLHLNYKEIIDNKGFSGGFQVRLN